MPAEGRFVGGGVADGHVQAVEHLLDEGCLADLPRPGDNLDEAPRLSQPRLQVACRLANEERS